jgi:hypothetical protein
LFVGVRELSVSLTKKNLSRWLVEHGFEMRSAKVVKLNACV